MELKDSISQLKFEIKKDIVVIAVMSFFVIADLLTAWANVLRNGGGWAAFNIVAAIICAWCVVVFIRQIIRFKKEIKYCEDLIANGTNGNGN
jgi:hypothetical protein